MRVASLPMYDTHPAAVQAWWSGIAEAMRAEGIAGVPAAACWPSDLEAHWHDPHLLLSQTCGFPLVTALKGVVQVLGAFQYTAPGCAGIFYRSQLLVRQDEPGRRIEDFRGRIAAINDRQSHSGCRALRALVAPLAQDGCFFAREVESGSHRASLEWLRGGRADVAAIDCVSLAGFRRRAPELLAGLRVIGSTARAPGLPLVTSAHAPAAELRAMRRALEGACNNPRLANAREELFIRGFEALPAQAWDGMAAFADKQAG
jgi:ABC-type phosphate/phosphonate transport system substrate-binding protein